MRPFSFYLNSGKVVKQEKNIETSKGIQEMVMLRLKYKRSFDLNEENSSILFGDFYEIIRELIQSAEGYKPYSHEAIVSFAFENKLLDEGESLDFDKYRLLRHESMYYGKKVHTEETKRIKIMTENLLNRLGLKNEI